jgi:hypothetical protein
MTAWDGIDDHKRLSDIGRQSKLVHSILDVR